MTDAPRWTRHPRVVVREEGEGAVALHLDTHVYFELDAAARFVWEALGDAGATVDEVVARVVEAWDTSADEARPEVEAALRTFAREGLVTGGRERRRDRLRRWLRRSRD